MRGSRIAAADPSNTTLADLAATGQHLADQARSSSEAILLLPAPTTSPTPQPAAADTAKQLTQAGNWATMLDYQLKSAVNIHALICTKLSDRAAAAEEWKTDPNQQLRSPASARTLATHARMLRDSVSSQPSRAAPRAGGCRPAPRRAYEA